MLYFAADEHLKRMRSTIMSYLPMGTWDWGEYHAMAAERILQDIRLRWFPDAARRNGTPDAEFDSANIRAGWHWRSSVDDGPVAVGDRVHCDTGHVAGGVADHIYEAAAEFAGNLTAVDFSGADWIDVTAGMSDVLRDAATYLALHYIYQHVSPDQTESGFLAQRDHFRGQYEQEISRIINSGAMPYDWTGDAVADELPRSGPPGITVVW